MKVILTDEIRGLGERGEIVTVKDGYARNYLLPKKLAKEATPGNVAVVEQQRRKWDLLAQEEKQLAEKQAARINGLAIEIEKKVGESGTLYGSVTSHEIADLLEAKGFEVDKRRIELGEPIKSLGDHEVEIRLHREVSAKIRVKVLPEGGEQTAAAQPAAAEAAKPEAVEPAAGTEAAAEPEAATGSEVEEAPAE
jgi:large subunit ribosomal protein L9